MEIYGRLYKSIKWGNKMSKLIPLVLAIILVGMMLMLGQDFGDKTFSPNKITLSSFEVKDNILQFNDNNLNSNYSNKSNGISLKNIVFKNSDKIELSYNYDKGIVIGVRELYVNGNLVWKKGDLKELEFNFNKQ